MSEQGRHTLVIGDGGWGTALALALHRAGQRVVVWSHDATYAAEVARSRQNSKFLPRVHLPEDLGWTGDLDEATQSADEFYSVVPTQFLRGVLERFGDRLNGLQSISASKGLEIGSLKRPSEIIREVLPLVGSIGVLSGPSHAEETALGLSTLVVVAAEDASLAVRAQSRLGSEGMRLYTSEDLVGVELGGALKNIMAVAAGIGDGIGLGDNAKAALVSRGLVEMARFGEHCGAQRETFFGLSGAGDLMVTCYSRHSRNRALGERIGRGETLAEIQQSTDKVAEGVFTCKAIHGVAAASGVEMPITEALHAVLFDGRDARDAVRELMGRPPRAELDPIS